MSAAIFLSFRNDVCSVGNNFAILRLPKFVLRVQRVLIFLNYILRNISRVFTFVNLTKNSETAKMLKHQYHKSNIQTLTVNPIKCSISNKCWLQTPSNVPTDNKRRLWWYSNSPITLSKSMLILNCLCLFSKESFINKNWVLT